MVSLKMKFLFVLERLTHFLVLLLGPTLIALALSLIISGAYFYIAVSVPSIPTAYHIRILLQLLGSYILICILFHYYMAITTTSHHHPILIAQQNSTISYNQEDGLIHNAVTLAFCKICRSVKQRRTHHCSVCNRCILKFDHHCPWINGWYFAVFTIVSATTTIATFSYL